MKYSKYLRGRVFAYLEAGGRKTEASRIFSVHRSTIYVWLNADPEELDKKIKHRRHRKLDWQALKRNVQEHPDWMLKERAACFNVSKTAICYGLREMKISYKKTLLYKERDHIKRMKYLSTLRTKLIENTDLKLVYADESGFEQQYFRPQAWGKIGRKVHGERSGKRWVRTNLIAAKSKHTMLAPFLIEGSVDSNVFNLWLERNLIPVLPENSLLILDNAAFHNKKFIAKTLIEHGHDVLFLPPYSPGFNPIEKWFGVLKRKLLAYPHMSIEDALKVSDWYCE